MGGADFVQWHGNYEILRQSIELSDKAAAIRAAHQKPDGGAPLPSLVDPPTAPGR
jgi:hypothetical protein